MEGINDSEHWLAMHYNTENGKKGESEGMEFEVTDWI